MTAFIIAATARSPNYLPQYLAKKLGFFRDEGLEVSVVAPDPWTRVLDHLKEGRADAVLGGAWLPAIFHRGVRKFRIFAQVNGRYPLALLTRTPLPGGRWEALKGRVVLVPNSGGPAAFILFTGLLREAGIDPKEITFLRDLSHEIFAELFVGGLGDAIITYMVIARRLVDAGHANLATSLDTVSGPMPNSVYYTTADVLARDNAAGRFTTGLRRALAWIDAHGVDNAEVRSVLAKEWPDEDQERLVSIVKSFRANGLWKDGVRVDRAALERWQRLIVEAGLLKTPLAYADLVDSQPVEFAEQSQQERDLALMQRNYVK